MSPHATNETTELFTGGTAASSAAVGPVNESQLNVKIAIGTRASLE